MNSNVSTVQYHYRYNILHEIRVLPLEHFFFHFAKRHVSKKQREPLSEYRTTHQRRKGQAPPASHVMSVIAREPLTIWLNIYKYYRKQTVGNKNSLCLINY